MVDVADESLFRLPSSPVGGGGCFGCLFPAMFSCCVRGGVSPPLVCGSRRVSPPLESVARACCSGSTPSASLCWAGVGCGSR